MTKDQSCIFCKIIAGEVPSHIVWSDDEHVAFLSIFPNTEGVTVVVPKDHHSSYFADVLEETATKLLIASRRVAKLLDEKLDDVGRTALVFEGFGVNHLHAKLFPMHGTKNMAEWKPIHSSIDTYFDQYAGYISSHDSKLADEAALNKVKEKIKS